MSKPYLLAFLSFRLDFFLSVPLFTGGEKQQADCASVRVKSKSIELECVVGHHCSSIDQEKRTLCKSFSPAPIPLRLQCSQEVTVFVISHATSFNRLSIFFVVVFFFNYFCLIYFLGPIFLFQRDV